MSIFEDTHIRIEPNPNDVQVFSTLYLVTSKVQGVGVQYNVDNSPFTVAKLGETKILVVNSCKIGIIIPGYQTYEFSTVVNRTEDNLINVLDNGTQVQKEEIELLSRNKILFNSIEKIDDNKYLRY